MGRASRRAFRALRLPGQLLLVAIAMILTAPATQAAETDYTWLFNGSTNGWTASSGTSVSSAGGSLHVVFATGGGIYTPVINYIPGQDTYHRDYVRFGYQIVSGMVGRLQFNFSTDTRPNFSSTSRDLSGLIRDGGWHYVTFRVDDIGDWSGSNRITQMRFVAIGSGGGGASGTMNFDFMALREDDKLPQTYSCPRGTDIVSVSPAGWTNGPITVTVRGNDPGPYLFPECGPTPPDQYGSGVAVFRYAVNGSWAGVDYNDQDSQWPTGWSQASIEVPPGSMRVGANAFLVHANDRVGFQATSSTSATLYYDPTPPVISDAGTSGPGTYSSNATVTFSLDDEGRSGVQGYSVTWDNSSRPGAPAVLASYGSVSIGDGGAPYSSHALYVHGYDNLGNATTKYMGSWTYVPPHSILATAGANGSISPSGTITVGHGASQTFTITPSACYRISDVVVDGASVGAVSSYTFSNVQSNRSISAYFALNTYAISASAGAGGSISPGSGSVNCGSSPTYTITPSACYRIADVVVDGASVGAVSSYTFSNVQASHSISASFAITTYTISASAGAGGSISPGSVSVNCGSSQTFTIAPNACCRIADVVVDGSSVGTVGSYTFTNVQSGHSIAASFADATAPDVHVLYPNGGESLVAGSMAMLTWVAIDSAGVTGVDLYLSRGGPSGTFTPLVAGIPNSGTVGWMVTGPASSDCYLKVVAHDANGNTGEDRSDMAFAIAVVRDSIVWCPEQRITSDTPHSEAPDLAATASGVHVVWQEKAEGDTDFGVRFSSGARQWPADTLLWQSALALSGAPSSHSPSIAVDSQDRLHVVWVRDEEPATEEVYYRRWNGTWSEPECLRTGQNPVQHPSVMVDGAADVHVMWSESVLGQGTIYHKRWHSAWVPEEVVSAGTGQADPDLAADPQNRLHAVWLSSGGDGPGVYYKSWDTAWGDEGRVNAIPVAAESPAVTVDAVGRIHVVWSDSRTGHPEVYYRSGNGTTWDAEFAVSPLDANNSVTPEIGVDGAGRIHVVWSDTRDGNPEIYHRIWDGAWLPAVRVTDAGGNSSVPRIVCSGDYLYLAWTDERHGHPEIYWRKGTVCPNGNCEAQPTPTLASLAESRVEGDRVLLRWYVSGAKRGSAVVYRQAPGKEWTSLGERSPDGTGYLAFEDVGVTAGLRYGYRLGLRTAEGEVIAGETWVDVPALGFALQGVRPNPAEGVVLSVHFTLPDAAPASLALYDVSGRQIQKLDVGSLGAGAHVVELRPHSSLAAGVYLLRLSQGPRAATQRVALVR